MEPIAAQFNVKAVGVTFMDGYPGFFHRLAPACDRAAKEHKQLEAWLVREPSNKYDANAILVEVPEIGRIGHIPRTLAERLAPHLDAGEKWKCSIASVLLHPDHLDRPGIDLLIQKVS